jgi:hypothetical protein
MDDDDGLFIGVAINIAMMIYGLPLLIAVWWQDLKESNKIICLSYYSILLLYCYIDIWIM